MVKRLSASLEDYLEAIGNLVVEHRVARAKDIAARLGVHSSSVTGALRGLSAMGLINYDPYSFVTLTASGQARWQEITCRHDTLKRFLDEVLGLDEEVAQRNACRIEHAIEPQVLERLLQFFRYLDESSQDKKDWMAAFQTYCCDGHKTLSRKERKIAPTA